jgi:hypothetical protein
MLTHMNDEIEESGYNNQLEIYNNQQEFEYKIKEDKKLINRFYKNVTNRLHNEIAILGYL